MNKYKRKYQKIVNELIKESFPELKNEKIVIKESPGWLDLSFVFYSIKNSFIFVNQRLKNESSKSVKGILVHELCHIEIDKKYSKLKKYFYWLLINLSWLFNTSFSRKVEREADLLTIRKGHGKELLSHSLKRKKRYSKKRLEIVYSRGYLSPEQIKKYMKKYEK